MNYFFMFIFALLATAIATPIIDQPIAEGRIWNGDEVQLGYAPYMASLRSLTNVHFCGGTIVSDRYILTSAGCVNGRGATSISIIIGTLIRTDVTNRYVSSAIVIHPGYNPQTLQNDIALVMTATVILTENIRTAGIHPDLYVDNLTVSVSGWGIISKDVSEPINLHSKNTTLISNEDCRTHLKTTGNEWRITENKICTSYADVQGLCYGDEGGALIYSYAVVGVASWHSYCTSGIPNVYERISGHRLWVMSYIN